MRGGQPKTMKKNIIKIRMKAPSQRAYPKRMIQRLRSRKKNRRRNRMLAVK